MSKPKKGDAVSVRLVGAGVTTHDPYAIDRVTKDKVYVDGLEEPFDLVTGKYLGFEIPGFRMSVLFDGGRAAGKTGDQQ